MLGGMSAAHAHIPHPSTGMDHVALLQAGIAHRQRRADIGEVERAVLAALLEDLRIHATCAPEGQRLRRRAILDIEDQHARHQPACARRPEIGAAAVHYPARHADMVGVMMGGDHASDGFALQGAGEDILPQRHAALRVDAGIDQRPAVALVQRVDIDVIEHHGQRQLQPEHPRRDLGGLGGCGRCGPRVAQKIAAIHHAAKSSDVSA